MIHKIIVQADSDKSMAQDDSHSIDKTLKCGENQFYNSNTFKC